METAYIALGSNLGDRAGYLALARKAINTLSGTAITKESPVEETAPLNNEPQPGYLNQVVEVKTALEPLALLDELLAIETELGRVRDSQNRYASRTIDLDILLYGEEVINHPRLQVPHPRMNERAFILNGLKQIGFLKDEVLEQSVRQRLIFN